MYRQRRIYTPLFFLLLLPFFSGAQYRCQDLKYISGSTGEDIFSINNNGKSDTIDILHYDLNLDLYEISSGQLKGNARITSVPKVSGVGSMEIDLLKFQIDSVTLNGNLLTYSYNDTLVNIELGDEFDPTDTLILNIGYHGQPQGDASGWGGFHRENAYYYNLGVGFDANPHTYGRAWFPCFDNFVEKSTYSFTVLTKDPNKAYCNGIRISEQQKGDSIISQWNMSDRIPTYLASVAVSNYEEIHDTVDGREKTLPIQLMSKASDTSRMKSSFANLKPVLHSLENSFGPYRWQKIGYAVTTVGAMEHATSIHFPASLINGTLSGEEIMAHELAHHWWGNLLTCQTAEDMWINEGMAEFSSHLYQEDVYGREHYLNTVKDNAFKVLNNAHIRDEGYRAVYGLPHHYVYGMHVYQKGAMVAHNLRAYLGDSLFFSGLARLLQDNAYGNINTSQFEEQLEQITGRPLDDFFNNWILNPGFASFAIDSLYSDGNTAFVKITQNTREAPDLFSNVPVDVTFFDENGQTAHRTVHCSGVYSATEFHDLPFHPVFALASYRGHLLSGDTYDDMDLGSPAIYADKYGKMRIRVNTIEDTTRLISMYHWAGPADKRTPGKDYRISESRYWTIRGFAMDKADITGRIYYDGTPNGFDQNLLLAGEDSLVVLYRAQPWHAWELYDDQEKSDPGNTNDKKGYFDLHHLRPGDYVLANSSEKVGIQELENQKGSIKVYPNPAQNKLYIDLKKADKQAYNIRINDLSGKLLYKKELPEDKIQDILSIDLDHLKASIVLVTVNEDTFTVSLSR